MCTTLTDAVPHPLAEIPQGLIKWCIVVLHFIFNVDGSQNMRQLLAFIIPFNLDGRDLFFKQSHFCFLQLGQVITFY